MVFAYFGPETVLPVTSTLAAVVGVALMLGKQAILMPVRMVMVAAGRTRAGKPGVEGRASAAGLRGDGAAGARGPHTNVRAGEHADPAGEPSEVSKS